MQYRGSIPAENQFVTNKINLDCCAVVCNLGSPIRQKENYNPEGVIVVMPIIVVMPKDKPIPIPAML
jgi:hypothetical protein